MRSAVVMRETQLRRGAWSHSLVGAVAALTLAGIAGGGPVSAATPPPLPPLTVAGAVLRNASGGQVLLRGVNLNALVAYSPAAPEAVPLVPGTFRAIAGAGWDAVRLALSLSALEPAPGRIAPAYLAAIQAAVARAARAGLYVVLDLHQDRYAAGLFPGESDGMPPFMVDPLGQPRRPILFGITDPAVQGAFTAFWENRRVAGAPLQHWYLVGLGALARAFAGNPAIAGFDVMNEPNPGDLVSPDFASRYLLPFYAAAVRTIRAAGAAQPIWLEPDVVSAALGGPPWPASAVPRAAGVVFAPHLYDPAQWLGREAAILPGVLHGLAPVVLRHLAALAAAQAAMLGVPWVIGEYGTAWGPAGDAQVQAVITAADAARVGAFYWVWALPARAYPWNLVTPAAALAAPAARWALVAAPYPPVVGGTLTALTYYPQTRVLTLRARLTGAGPTVLTWTSWTYPAGAILAANRPATITARTTRWGSLTETRWTAVVPPGHGVLMARLAPAGGRTAQDTSIVRQSCTAPGERGGQIRYRLAGARHADGVARGLMPVGPRNTQVPTQHASDHPAPPCLAPAAFRAAGVAARGGECP